LTKNIADFSKQMNILRGKLGPEGYKNLARDVTKILSSISETSLIQRRTPKHEWILPYLIKETKKGQVIEYFCLIGAEVKAKQLGMGYQKGGLQSNYQFTPIFIYGTNDSEGDYGAKVDQRNVRGQLLNEYSSQNEHVVEQFLKFFEMIKEK